MNLKRLMRLADKRKVRDGFWKPYNPVAKFYTNEWYDRQILKSGSKKEFGVDFDTTLEWVKKKNPNMSADEQEKFAQNIINKKERENNARLAQIEKNREEFRKQSEEQERIRNENMVREQEMRERDGYDEMSGVEKFYYDQRIKGDHWTGD